jgi:hypothetical protein
MRVSTRLAEGQEMEVRVKLGLQGGHSWEFCCDQDDPIVFGLVSALRGADSGGLPPDGLIQIETRAGGRLYLAASSLISVDVLPILDDLQFMDANRLAPSSKPTEGISSPSPFMLVPQALPAEVHRALLAHVLTEVAVPQREAQDGACELSLGPLYEQVTKGLRSQADKSCTVLGVPDPLAIDMELKLFAVGNGKSIPWDAKPDDLLSFVYHFHKQPKAFTGGGIRLFDSRMENGVTRAAVAFRDVEIDDNSALIFPASVVRGSLPVHCATRVIADGLFALCGSLRKRLPSE